MAYKKLSSIVKNTGDSRTYNRSIKVLRERRGELSCSRCPYHRGSNSRTFRVTNWKHYRKTQWKVRD